MKKTGILLVVMTVGGMVWGEGVDFNRQIRPLISDNCLFCHGPDGGNRKADLRLDVEEVAKADRGGYAVIVPGDPGASEIMRRLLAEDEDDRMPPPESNKSLSAEEIELIRTWIEEGAEWETHWAFAPVERPELPEVGNPRWPRNAIDRFILARMEAEGLRPSPPADRATLIRRVTFDLTGLPPTPEEVSAFLADNTPGAYERLVNRLLGSSRYGEHMARFWLDAARYGDTHGLHLDNYREMWPYRDWVVRAFNDNKPYDQFVIEQLAGDLLQDPTDDQLVATGFNRCHVTTNEGGSIREEVYVRNVVDRVVTTGTVFMGLTMECTRCHDHKFDPLTMDDFYSMFAYFNSMDGDPLDGNRKDPPPVLRLPNEEQRRRLAELDEKIGRLEARMRDPWPEIDRLQRAWEEELAASLEAGGGEDAGRAEQAIELGDWYTVGPFSDNRRYLNGRKHGPEGKPINLKEEFELADGTKVGWERRPDWVDAKVHQDLPGQTAANFLYRTLRSPQARKVSVSLGSDDGIKVYLNGRQVLAKDVQRGAAADQDVVELPLQEGENELLIKIMNFGGASGFYFALRSGAAAIPEEVLELVRQSPAIRTDEAVHKLREFYRNKVAAAEPLLAAQQELKELRGTRADVDREIPTTMIYRETPEPKPAYILIRGEYDQHGEQVGRRTPSVLPPMGSDLPNNRLGLAKWLVSPEHPLTTRVTVNRLWLQVFGVGLVKTAEDFGSQGSPPSHPELLDWLASEFRASGWNVKALMKEMVMSAAYRQSSRVTPELFKRDPENRLLARGPRFRLDAEMLRDQALFVSGLLVEKMGGPSVKPPQPDGLWFAVGYSGSNTVRFSPDEGPEKVHRRTLYTFIKRTAPPPQLSTFDAPSRESCTVRRERTNTPLQALLLMNDPQYFEAARALAERTLHECGGSPRDRAVAMFRRCTGRSPTAGEVEEILAGVREDRDHYSENVESAEKLIAVGEVPPASDIPAPDLAAWTLAANLMLNLDEVVTKN